MNKTNEDLITFVVDQDGYYKAVDPSVINVINLSDYRKTKDDEDK